ncbi:carboxymuconolactone decarboxylase family protein [Pontibacter sp. E15-1]|uniref:carboxymuconolactone decarboxylase family protein n=1 Tax=Pontibacter sp. E15-1 TaxID=2919918 RepID=UPI001F500211|nr:carboxymuconolactone decarboxylase family protein [Pontibacter sp. E15-1]MCJ8163222.1 carboxymuconolactone decarboxylase family protein [Pontibacter sp. E15-1]
MDNQKFKTSLNAVTLDNANDAQKPLLETSQKQMGMIPNMYANMVNSPGVMETYAVGYDRFRKNSGFSPVEQEVVFVTISVENGCEYCAAAHSYIADNVSKVPVEVTNAIRDGKQIEDAKLNALATFTRVMFDKRGNPSHSEVQAFTEAGYAEQHVLEIILALAVKTLSNYSNHIFGTEVDAVFSGRAWSKN